MWKIKKIFSFNPLKPKKKVMNPDTVISPEEKIEIETRYRSMEFQWVKGDDQGMTETFSELIINEDDIFLAFTSGKRMNSNLLEEYMIYYPLPLNIESLDQVQYSRPTNVTSVVISEKVNSTESPIYKLLKKQKKNQIDVSIKLKLNLPSKDLYNILASSFDDAEKEIIDFVLSDIDIDDIKAALAESIKKSYYVNDKVESKNAIVKKEKIKDV